MTEEPLWQTPERYLHTGPAVVLVPARVAAVLLSRTDLGDYHHRHRGADPEVDAVLVALKTAAARWRTFVGASEPRNPAKAVSHYQWMNASQVAERLGLTPAAVRLACREGRIKAEQVDGRWRISREEVEHQRVSRAAA